MESCFRWFWSYVSTTNGVMLPRFLELCFHDLWSYASTVLGIVPHYLKAPTAVGGIEYKIWSLIYKYLYSGATNQWRDSFGEAQVATVRKKKAFDDLMAYCVDLRACLDLFYDGADRQTLEEVGILVR